MLNPCSGMFQGLVRLRDCGFSPTGILDIGAYEGQFSRGARQIFSDASIFMIDALAEKAPLLAQTCEELGNADYLIGLLGDKEMGATPFFVVNPPSGVQTGSSKFKENNNFSIEERMLPQRTLEDILTRSDFVFQLLKIDVQGAEIDVLRGMRHRLSMIEVILTEVSLVEYNNGAPLIASVLGELSRMGFVLYDIVEELRVNGRLLQIDGLFLRPSSRFRAQPPFLG